MLKYLALAGLLASPLVAAEDEPRDPETIFDQYCFTCHGTGWENAPVIGDDFAWEDRREKGMDVLFQNTWEGFNSMPPRGGCDDCSKEELRAAVEWLVQ